MEQLTRNRIERFDDVKQDVIESLFQSKGFFWLTTAVSTGLAAEEMERFCGNGQQRTTEQVTALFNTCIRANAITEQQQMQAMDWSLEHLRQIDQWNRSNPVFHERCSLGISKGFVAYWLNYKLIELEWQQVLGSRQVEEIYQFLDQVLADGEELDAIEQAQKTGTVTEDQRLFLRSHWKQSQFFWTKLYTSLQLFSLNLIEMRQPR